MPNPQRLGLVAQGVGLLLHSRDQSAPVPGASVVEVRDWFVVDVEPPEEIEGEGGKGTENGILVSQYARVIRLPGFYGLPIRDREDP